MGLFSSCVRGGTGEPFSPRQTMPQRPSGAPDPRPAQGPGAKVGVGQPPLPAALRWGPRPAASRQLLLPNVLQPTHSLPPLSLPATTVLYSPGRPPPTEIRLPSSPFLPPGPIPFPWPSFADATLLSPHPVTWEPFPVPFPQTVYAEPHPSLPSNDDLWTPSGPWTQVAPASHSRPADPPPGAGITYQQVFFAHRAAPMDPALCDPMPTRTEGYRPRRARSLSQPGRTRTGFPENTKSLSPDMVKVQLFPPPEVQAQAVKAGYASTLDPVPFPNLDGELPPAPAALGRGPGTHAAYHARDSFRSSLGPKTVLFGETTAYSPLPRDATPLNLSQQSGWVDGRPIALEEGTLPRSWQTMDLGSASYQAPSTIVSMNSYRLPSRRSSLVSTHLHGTALPPASPGPLHGPTVVNAAVGADGAPWPWGAPPPGARGGRRRRSAPPAPVHRPAA